MHITNIVIYKLAIWEQNRLEVFPLVKIPKNKIRQMVYVHK